MIFFGLVYFAQGIGQAGGLINQPLMNYLKAQGLTSDQVAQLFAVLTIPWIIKPLYGLIDIFNVLDLRLRFRCLWLGGLWLRRFCGHVCRRSLFQ